MNIRFLENMIEALFEDKSNGFGNGIPIVHHIILSIILILVLKLVHECLIRVGMWYTDDPECIWIAPLSMMESTELPYS